MLISDWSSYFCSSDLWIYIFLLVLIPLIGVAEISGWFQLEYSKFRPTQGGMSSRLGMFILYFVPIPTYLWFAASYLDHATTTQWLLSVAMVGHFANDRKSVV